jgi:hypothetical protein
MSGPAIVFMVVVCTFVWGGFSVLLFRAIRSERRKTDGD